MKNHVSIVLFLAIELFLYLSILFFHFGLPSGYLHYLSIVLCFVFLIIHYQKSLDYQIIFIGLFFTVIADFYLTLLGTEQILGTFFFFLAQTMYMIRLNYSKKKHFLESLIPYLFVFILLLVFVGIVILQKIDLLLIVSFLYYSFLLTNLGNAFVQRKANPLLFLGLIFYLCCDTLVGLSMSTPYITFASGGFIDQMIHFPINLIWFFYLPSQILITLSAKRKNQEII
ncbi:MAG: lysoplasmalogenase family protein [Candidatus Izemoplasmatales bacterium]